MAAARSRSASSPRRCRICRDGRLLLGLGVANKTIAAWHNGVFDRPLRRAREYIEIVRKVAAGERVEYEGEIYNTGKRFELSWTPSYPQFPIYLAGLGPQMTKLVGKISDGVFINMGTPETIKEIAGRVRAGADRSGPRSQQPRDHRQGARVAESGSRGGALETAPGADLLQHRRSL